MTRFILEVKHHAPYPGCFHHWEYYDVRSINRQIVLQPIYAAPIRTWITTEKAKFPIWADNYSDTSGFRWLTWDEAKDLLDPNAKDCPYMFSEARLFVVNGLDLTNDSDYPNLGANGESDDRRFSIPDDYLPNFWDYVRTTHGHLTWKCENHGLTDQYPTYPASPHGGGGIYVCSGGYVCSDCPDPDEPDEYDADDDLYDYLHPTDDSDDWE